MADTIYLRQEKTLIVKPSGRLDTATSPVLEKELHQHLDGIENVLMDFESVEYISSSELRMLLATEQLLEHHGGSLKLQHVNEYIMEVFEMVNFTDVVEVVRD